MTAEAGAIRLVMALRRGGISDTAILSAVERTPREAFLPDALVAGAWDDAPVDLGNGAILSRPFLMASLIEALRVGDRHRVLQVPTGSGYLAALLSQFCRWVYTRDPDRAMRRAAEDRLRVLGIPNVVVHSGAPEAGWPEQAPFDRILVSTGLDDAPPELLDQLRPDGIFVAPLGPDPLARILTRIARTVDGFESEALMSLPPAVLGHN